MTQIIEKLAPARPRRTVQYRNRFTPVSEPWQRAADSVDYEPRHADPGNAR